MASEHTVFIFGSTGSTGSSIVNGLLAAKKYHVIAGVRPASLEKPEVLKLKERGVEIRAVELTSSPSELDAALKGANTVISAVKYDGGDDQKNAIDSAKRVGAKRFIPNDWATPCERGVRTMYDQKAAIQDYIKSVGLGYTFIDVGLWAHLSFPQDTETHADTFIPSLSHLITAGGNVKNATTAIEDIGRFVAAIIDDDRTLNKYVFIWGEEKTQKEIWEIARKVKSELGMGPLKARERYESAEDVVERAKKAEKYSMAQAGAQYMLSLAVRGDNTVENAKKPEFGGALDAKELYPDIKVTTMEEVAKALYGQK